LQRNPGEETFKRNEKPNAMASRENVGNPAQKRNDQLKTEELKRKMEEEKKNHEAKKAEQQR